MSDNIKREVTPVIIVSLIILMCLSPTLFPPFQLYDVVIVYWLIKFNLSDRGLGSFPRELGFGALLAMIYLLSGVWQIAFSDLPIGFHSITPTLMIIKYMLLYVMVYKVNLYNRISIFNMLKVISLVGMLSSIVGVCQYYNYLNVNYWLTPLYITQEFYLDKLQFIDFNRRVIGTSFNPNHYAFLLSFSLTSSLILAFSYKQSRYFIVTLIVGVAILYTLSRTGYLVAVMSLGALVLLTLLKGKKYYLAAFLVAISIITSFMILPDSNSDSDSASRVSASQLDIHGENSIAERIRTWKDVIYDFKKEPGYWFLGVGSDNEEFSKLRYIDNQYIDSLITTGFAGVVTIIGIQVLVYLSSIKYFFKSKSPGSEGVSLFVIITMTALFVFEVTAVVVNDTQNIGIIIFSWALFFSHKRKRFFATSRG